MPTDSGCDAGSASAVLLVDSASRFLLQHRTDDAPFLPGQWSFFGGHIEPGETPLEGAVREALEELEYSLKAPRFLFKRDYVLENRRGTIHAFCEKFEGTDADLCLHEGQGMGWFDIEEIGALSLNEFCKGVILDAFALVKKKQGDENAEI